MLDPNYLLHISEGGENIASQLHTEIIRRMVYRIMLRIGRGEDYILTAFDIENELVLGQLPVDEKTNEITVMPELIELLDLENTVITEHKTE